MGHLIAYGRLTGTLIMLMLCVLDHYNYASWRTVVGVTVDSDSVTLYLQPRPSSAFFSVQLVYTRGKAVQLEDSQTKWLEKVHSTSL